VRSLAKGSALGLLCGLLVAGAGETMAGSAAGTELAVATDARLGGDEARTRFVLDLSKRVEVSAFTLADPYRIVLDLPQVIFQLPARVGESGRGLVKAFRFGLVMQGGSRIVLDATAPVRVEKAFVIDPVDSQPARLVLDLVAIDRDSFLRNIALENRPRRSEPPVKTDRDAKDTDPRPLIVLDPGHGGLDSGTIAPTGDTEKNIVLEFAQQLRGKLEKSGKYRVAMTRTDDRFVSLADRVQVARLRQAALFLSIHADALPHRDSEARGASIYTLSETASDAEAARLAEAENRADVIAGVDLSAEPNDVADILIDLAQRETKAFSANFAHALAKELKVTSRLHKHPLKSAGFRVLKAPDVPSALIELGYVSSSQDLKYLMSDAWRTRATDSIVQAIATYFATRLAGTGAAGGSN
jgi:N-acetylmuramoyl-L-alanine amidase